MSLGYAEKLSYIEDVGNVGMAEFFDSTHVLQEKVKFFPLSFSFGFFNLLLVFPCLLVLLDNNVLDLLEL